MRMYVSKDYNLMYHSSRHLQAPHYHLTNLNPLLSSPRCPTQGSSEANILFVVVEDLMPELSERYTLTLTGVRTVSADVSPTGYALLSNTNTMATITIAASNSPHGVIEFLQSATVLNISETTATQLTIIREFGTIGELPVSKCACA